MKTRLTFILTVFLLGAFGLHGQVPNIKLLDPDAEKFVGTWTYESPETTFSVTFVKDILDMGKFKMEVLTGSWRIKNQHGEKETIQSYAIMGNTGENPKRLEGKLLTEDYRTRYYFTLEVTDAIGMEARWTVTKTRNNRAVDEMRELYPPPTTCVMEKQLILLPPPSRPGNSDDETSVIL